MLAFSKLSLVWDWLLFFQHITKENKTSTRSLIVKGFCFKTFHWSHFKVSNLLHLWQTAWFDHREHCPVLQLGLTASSCLFNLAPLATTAWTSSAWYQTGTACIVGELGHWACSHLHPHTLSVTNEISNWILGGGIFYVLSTSKCNFRTVKHP